MEQNIIIKDLQKAILEIQKDVQEIKKTIVTNDLSEEDLEFNEGTRAAQEEIDRGEGIIQSKKEFLEEFNSL